MRRVAPGAPERGRNRILKANGSPEEGEIQAEIIGARPPLRGVNSEDGLALERGGNSRDPGGGGEAYTVSLISSDRNIGQKRPKSQWACDRVSEGGVKCFLAVFL